MKQTIKTTKITLLLLLTFFVATSCSKDGETEPVPKQDFAGNYVMEDFEVRVKFFRQDKVYSDTTLTVTVNPEIQFLKNEDLGKGELKVNLNEFSEVLWELQSSGGVDIIAKVDPLEESIAEMTENDFIINTFSSKVGLSGDVEPISFIFDFSADGKLKDGKLTFKFEQTLSGSDGTLSFTGTAIGHKK